MPSFGSWSVHIPFKFRFQLTSRLRENRSLLFFSNWIWIMNIFCDEAGFTGNNLLDAEQDIFVYATVATPVEIARERVERIIRDCRLQGKELKGSRLVRSG